MESPGPFARRGELVRTIAVVAIGLVAVSIYAFPGLMAWDSVEQLAQARSGELTDWHPPLMSAIWGVLDRVIEGPATMLLLQCGLFLVGLHAILRRRLTPWRAAIATLLIFVFPPTLTMMAVVVKDPLMCGALLVGVAGLTSPRRGLRIASLFAFSLAAGLRYNAIALVVPLLAVLSPWPARRGRWVRAAAGAAIALGVTAAAWLANHALTDQPTHPFHTSVATMDIVGILHFAPALDDAEVRGFLEGVPLARPAGLQAHANELYDPNRWWGELIYNEGRFFGGPPDSPAARGAIAAGWWRLVKAYPGAYLATRFDMFRELLGLTHVTYAPVYAARNERSMLANTYQPPRPRSRLQRWLGRRMLALGKTSLMFRPYAYAVLALALLIVLRRDRLVTGLLVSAITCTGALIVVMPAPDIRYVYWLMLTVMIGIAIRFLGRSGSPEPEPP